VEWTLFIAVELLRGELETGHQILVASYPLAFFYLVACALVALSQRTRQLAGGWKLLGLATGLTVADQLIKATIVASIPYQTSTPVVEGWLHLAHQRNVQGSWLISTFNVRPVGTTILMLAAASMLPLSIVCHRYYVSTHRKSVWADVAFVGLWAGCASWACDMGLRGHIVDFIGLPSVVTADFKDILVAVGVAAFFAEALDNPNVSLRWRGWRREGRESLQLAMRIGNFILQEWRGIRQVWRKRLGKGPRA